MQTRYRNLFINNLSLTDFPIVFDICKSFKKSLKESDLIEDEDGIQLKIANTIEEILVPNVVNEETTAVDSFTSSTANDVTVASAEAFLNLLEVEYGYNS